MLDMGDPVKISDLARNLILRLVVTLKKAVPDYSPSQELLERMVAQPVSGLGKLNAAVAAGGSPSFTDVVRGG